MICPHCDHENEEGNRFCTGCGELLSKRTQGRPAERPTTETPETETPEVTQTQAPASTIKRKLLLGLAVFVIFVLGITLFPRNSSIHRSSPPPVPPAVPFSPPVPPSPAPPRESVKVPAVPNLVPPSSAQVNSVEEKPVVVPQEKEKVVEKSVLVDQNLDRFINLPAKTEEEFKKFKQAESWQMLKIMGLNIPFDQLCRKAEDANKKCDWQQVIDLYTKALKIYPYYDASFRIANSYNQLNQPDKALAWTSIGLQKFRYSLLYEIAAEAYGKKGDETQMLIWLEGALKGGFKTSKEDMDRTFSRYKEDPRYSLLLQRYNISSSGSNLGKL